MSRKLWAVALLFALVAAACSSTQSADPPSCTTAEPDRTTHTYRDIDGVDPNLTSLDVWSGENPADCPVLVWVHGGSWQAGDKSTRLTTDKASYFNELGFVFVSVNYRLASDTNDIRWPDFGDDVAAAVQWVRDNAEDIGVDSDEITLMGHSSGAHLVSIVGTSPSLLPRVGADRSDVACVISLDSVTHDLTDEQPWETDIIDLSFPDDAAKVDGSPTLQALEVGDSSDAPAFLIVTRGRDARLDSAARLGDTINDTGGSAAVVDVSPYDHGEVSSQLGLPGEELVTPAVESFVQSCSGI